MNLWWFFFSFSTFYAILGSQSKIHTLTTYEQKLFQSRTFISSLFVFDSSILGFYNVACNFQTKSENGERRRMARHYFLSSPGYEAVRTSEWEPTSTCKILYSSSRHRAKIKNATRNIHLLFGSYLVLANMSRVVDDAFQWLSRRHEYAEDSTRRDTSAQRSVNKKSKYSFFICSARRVAFATQFTNSLFERGDWWRRQQSIFATARDTLWRKVQQFQQYYLSFSYGNRRRRRGCGFHSCTC